MRCETSVVSRHTTVRPIERTGICSRANRASCAEVHSAAVSVQDDLIGELACIATAIAGAARTRSVCSSTAQPITRHEQPSHTAHRSSVPCPVRWHVVSEVHTGFSTVVSKRGLTRS